jgi:hypothetical protein
MSDDDKISEDEARKYLDAGMEHLRAMVKNTGTNARAHFYALGLLTGTVRELFAQGVCLNCLHIAIRAACMKYQKEAPPPCLMTNDEPRPQGVTLQ